MWAEQKVGEVKGLLAGDGLNGLPGGDAPEQGQNGCATLPG